MCSLFALLTCAFCRASRKTPIQRTPLSSIGHTHPVYSLAVLGTQNANNLVTVSTDGRMCVWAFESLHQPLEVLELRNKQVLCRTMFGQMPRSGLNKLTRLHRYVQSKTVTGGGNVAPTCMAFSEGEVNEFFVGSEEATIYQAYRHGTYVKLDEDIYLSPSFVHRHDLSCPPSERAAFTTNIVGIRDRSPLSTSIPRMGQ